MDQSLFEKIDQLGLSPRAQSLRNMFFACQPGVASERIALATESWKETEGEPVILRRAKLVKKIMEGVPVVIHPGQLLVGSETKYFRGANPHIDFDASLLDPLLGEEEGRLTLGGPVEKGVVTREDWAALIDAGKFWRGKTCVDWEDKQIRSMVGSWNDDFMQAGHRFYGTACWAPGGFDCASLLHDGVGARIKKAEKKIQELIEGKEVDVEGLQFYQAAVIVLRALVRFANRHAEEARRMAAAEADPARRSELEEIASVCDWVPENPARTFQEALQCAAFAGYAFKMETGINCPASWGNVDQEFYPYFKRDLEAGRLSLEKAGDLVNDLLLTAARWEMVRDLFTREYQQKGNLSSMSLGGLTRDGRDASNELSYLFLHIMGLVAYAEPHLVIRWHQNTPRWLMLKALETNSRTRGGVPQFQNNDHIVNYLTQRGIGLEAARDWKSTGCSQAAPADNEYDGNPSYVNVPLCLDLALHNGVCSATGKQLGPKTGDASQFRSFEAVYDAFQKQFEFICSRQRWLDNCKDQWRAEFSPQPLISSLMPGCLEKGRDLSRGGLAHYANWFIKDRGLVPTTDSLLAIRKLVFESHKFTMGELLEALDTNFEGERGEEIRQLCLAAPKYGNDIDEADEMLCHVAKFTGHVIMQQKNVFGYPFAVNRNGQGWHSMAGKKLAALPNGRKRGDPLPDGSLSPMQGMDTNGPTAVLNSALKADFQESLAGIMTLKLPAMLLQNKDVREKVADLTETFLRNGGLYIQYNILDKQQLLEAKKHPEKYRDLLVRVGGFSAYFVTLSPDIQDEIIHRTEQDLSSL